MIHGNVELYNVEELLAPDDSIGHFMSRIPNRLRLSLNEAAKNNALSPAGCEIRFNLKDESAQITLSSESPAIAEVFQGCFQVSWHIIDTKPIKITVTTPQNIDLLEKVSKERKMPFDPSLTRLILPYNSPVRLIGIKGETSLPTKRQSPETRYLAYGSSITHGANAVRPTGSYAMRTAQILGVDLVNLGFGGGANCENQIADYIATREDWEFATLEMGINMVGSFSVSEFKDRIEYLVDKIVKAHPDKWIFAMDLFTFAADYDPSVRKQNEFRQVVKNTIKKLAMPKLVHIDGRNILKKAFGLTYDLVHPAPVGMEEIAVNLSNAIKEKMVNELELTVFDEVSM